MVGPGRLELTAAFELRSSDPRFGGLSALLVDGDRLLTLSDRGRLWSATLRLDGTGRLTGLGGWRVQELGEQGQPPDSESLARLPSGRVVVGLEGSHAVAEFDPRQPRASMLPARPLPAPLDGSPPNEGVEALVDLPDGWLLAISEGRVNGGEHAAVAWAEGKRPVVLGYRAALGFAPTGADRLGRTLLVLERRASVLGGLEARIVEVDLGTVSLAAGAVIQGRELARLDAAGGFGENYEGIAILRDPRGRLSVLVVSDDNFSALQRTLLLQLRWSPRARRSGAVPARLRRSPRERRIRGGRCSGCGAFRCRVGEVPGDLSPIGGCRRRQPGVRSSGTVDKRGGEPVASIQGRGGGR